jgi:microsomal dipeptidase-like Zn-dependent dipeptidase
MQTRPGEIRLVPQVGRVPSMVVPFDAAGEARFDDLPYLHGLESPAGGSNIVRGLIARGYSDTAIRKIAGQNALSLLRRVIG